MNVGMRRWTRGCLGISALAIAAAAGCGTGSLSALGIPFFPLFGTDTVTGGGTGSGTGGSGAFGGGGRAELDPCEEPFTRKFVNISMQNANPDTFVHYFFVAIAFVDIGAGGAVCEEDIALYTSNGYTQVAEGDFSEFGGFCVPGPALIYYHLNGQFQQGTGSDSLGSAIAPAQGSGSPTFDGIFSSAGLDLPVPDLIAFYNPGTGGGAALRVSQDNPTPCDAVAVGGFDSECQQDSFYYVDESDFLTGSESLGVGSGRRVANDVQGTSCECTGAQSLFQVLAPSGTDADSANCDEFARGGRIEYVFIRQDETPPFPQLLWRVTDDSGSVWQDFDTRADLP